MSVETEINSDLENLLLTLKKIGIKNVYSFDDEWNHTNINKTLYQKNLVEMLNDIGEEIETELEEKLDEEGIFTVEHLLNSKEEEFKFLKDVIESFLSKDRDLSELKILDSLFERFEKEGIVCKKLAKKINMDDIREIDGNILFLLDMNMENIGESNDVILNSLLEINKVRSDTLDIAVVYSHEKLLHFENHFTKTSYIEKNLDTHSTALGDVEKYLIAHQLWAITKEKEEEKLIKNLNEILSKAILGNNLHNYLRLKVNVMNGAIMELIRFSEIDFNFLLKDAIIEGESILKVLERTQQSLLSKHENIRKRTDTNYITSIEGLLETVNITNNDILREIMEVDKVDKFRQQARKEKVDTGIFKNLSEYGLVDYSINHTYEDLSTGDIFFLGQSGDNVKNYGILITANCDIPIRFGGKKFSEGVKRNEEMLSLLLFNSSDIDVMKDKIIQDKMNKLIWPLYESRDGEDQLIVLEPLDKVVQLDSRIIDICTLNKYGKAYLDISEEQFSKYKTVHFMEYFNNEIRGWLKDITSIHHYVEEKEMLENMDKNVDKYTELMASYKYNIKLDINEKVFNIQRVGRLNSGVTLKLLQTYANKIGRFGIESIPFL